MSDKRNIAFENLLRPHLNHLYRVAYRFTGNAPDAEDLIQDLVVKVYQRPDDIDGVERLRPWLTRVMYRMFIDNRRRYSRSPIHLAVDNHPHGDDEGGPLHDALPSNDPSPDEELEQSFKSRALRAAMERLSDDHRDVIMLHDVEGYTLEEIAKVLECPIGTLKSRIHRARARLRGMLEGTAAER